GSRPLRSPRGRTASRPDQEETPTMSIDTLVLDLERNKALTVYRSALPWPRPPDKRVDLFYPADLPTPARRIPTSPTGVRSSRQPWGDPAGSRGTRKVHRAGVTVDGDPVSWHPPDPERGGGARFPGAGRCDRLGARRMGTERSPGARIADDYELVRLIG